MRLPGSGNEMWRKCIVNGGQMLRSEGVCGGTRETFNVKAKFKCPGQGKVEMSALCQKRKLRDSGKNSYGGNILATGSPG